MARIPYVEPDLEVTQRIKERRGGKLRPLDMALLHNPRSAEGWNSLLGAVRRHTSLTDAEREAIICRVAALNGAQYEWDAHAPLAIKGGLNQEQVKFIGDDHLPESPLPERIQMLVDLTDQMTLDCEVSDELFATVQAEYGDTGVQDAVMTAATYNMVSRYLLALQVGEPQPANFGVTRNKNQVGA